MSGELKELAAEDIADFLEKHQERETAPGPLEEEWAACRLTETERQMVRRQAEYPDNALSQQ